MSRWVTLPLKCLIFLAILWAGCGINAGVNDELPKTGDPSQDPRLDAPILQAVIPSMGPSTGGTIHHVEGEHFAAGATVAINGIIVEDTVVLSSNKIYVRIPSYPGAIGPALVTVQNPDGKHVSRRDIFEYYSGTLLFSGLGIGNSVREDYYWLTSMLTDDFNNDGISDFAIADQKRLSIYLSDGSGGVIKTQDDTLGSFAVAMVSRDINHDNNMDLVIHALDARVLVMIGDGSGEFLTTFSNRLPSTSYDENGSVAVGDFNRDGNLDIAAALSGRVYIMTSTGTGSFLPATLSFSEDGLRAITVADFDGDGFDDLVAVSKDTNTALFLSYDGVRFIVRGRRSTGQKPISVAVGDVDGDGRADAVVGCQDGVSVLLASGFVAPQVAVPGGVGNVVIGDWNGDNKSDLALDSFTGGSSSHYCPANTRCDGITILQGDGQGGFMLSNAFASSPIPFYSDRNRFYWRSLLILDWNQDGYLDLANLTGTMNALVHLGDGKGGFSEPLALYGGVKVGSLVVADFDGDHRADIALTNGEKNVVLHLNDGQGGARTTASFTVGDPAIQSAPSCAVGDFNSDQKQDLAVVVDRDLSILIGDGRGVFFAQQLVARGVGDAVLTADLNFDGYTDMIIGDGGSQRIGVFLADGRGGISSPSWFATGVSSSAASIGDLNQDGWQDLVLIASDVVSVLQGDALGGFAAPRLLVAATSDISANNVAISDWNGDGWQDLAVSSKSGVTVLLGNGTGGFSSRIKSLGSLDGGRSMAVADWNGDHYLDLAVATAGMVRIMTGDGRGGFRSGISIGSFAKLDTVNLVVADVNGDLRPDVVAVGSGSESSAVWVLHNRSR